MSECQGSHRQLTHTQSCKHVVLNNKCLLTMTDASNTIAGSCQSSCRDSTIHVQVLQSWLEADIPILALVQAKVSRPLDVMMMTEPPPSSDAGGSTSQRRIFDAYKAHQDCSRAAEDQAKARSAVARRGIGELATAEDPVKVRYTNGHSQAALCIDALRRLPLLTLAELHKWICDLEGRRCLPE